jgi:hypothetical protein
VPSLNTGKNENSLVLPLPGDGVKLMAPSVSAVTASPSYKTRPANVSEPLRGTSAMMMPARLRSSVFSTEVKSD